jgi:predicted GNAT family acetyltransferase/GNAT superfamily N-acetyltransferase
MSLEKYIKQYEEMSAQNPMDPRERYFYMGKSNGEHCLVLTDVSIFDGTIHISSIQTRPAVECEGKGFASEVLGKLVKLADENDVVMSLDPTPFAQATIDSEGLERWYARNGFVDDPEFGGMRRAPRVSEATRKLGKNSRRLKHKGSSGYFRVTLPGIGYAEGGEHLRFKECQEDVDALMKTPEYLEVEERFNSDPKNVWGDGERKKFRPRFYDVENAWISNPENRGKGYGKQIYSAFIEKAVEYSRSSGGVFIGAHHCTIGSGTSEAAKRVWRSLARDYTSSGDVIFVRTN